MSGVKSRLAEGEAVETPFRPSLAIPKSDVQSAIEAVQTDLATVEATLAAAQIIVAAAHAGLGAERVLTDTATVAWDTATAAQMKANVVDDSITFAKMQNLTSDRLLGRDTASSGDPEEITVGGGIEFTGSGGIQTSAFTGDATKAAGGTALTLATVNASPGTFGSAANVAQITVNGKGLVTAASNVAIAIASSAVTDFTEAVQDVIGALFIDSAEINWVYDDALNTFTQNIIDGSVALSRLANQAALTVLANATNGSAAVTALAAASNDRVLARTADALSFAQLTVGMFPDAVVTYAKIQNISATDRLLGRDTAGAGVTEEISLNSTLEFTGSASIQRAALTGAIAATAGSNTTTAPIQLTMVLGDGTNVLATSIRGYLPVNFAGTITGWRLVAKESGSCVIDVWLAAGAVPTNSDSVAGSEKPTLSSAQLNTDSSLSTWTDTAFAAGDIFGFEVESATTVTQVTLILYVTKTG